MPLPKENMDPNQVMIVEGVRCGVASHPVHGDAMMLALYGQDGVATLPMIMTEQMATDVLDAIQKTFPLAFPKGHS